jgi:hypothetical protein
MGYETTASGYASTSMGRGTVAAGEYATATGRSSQASGDFSKASGYETIASGNTSNAMGFRTVASGSYSTAIGYESIANGNISTAIGDNTETTGDYSISKGRFTNSLGRSSIAMGIGTIVKSAGGMTVGWYNDTLDSPTTTTQPTDRLFQIGNGHNGPRSNAMTVLFNGNTGIGTTTPEQKMDIDGGFILRDGGVIASAATTNITPSSSNRAYYRIAPTNTPANRAITLEDGTEPGQIIILQCQAASGANGVRLTDGGNIVINTATLDLLNNDIATFIWDGNEWILMSYINN